MKMNDIPYEMLAEVLGEIEEELGHPDEYAVPIDELLGTLRTDDSLSTVPAGRQYRSSG
jgi:hypothetical protein